MQYLHDQADATGEVPSDETVIVERYLDEVGDWRVCVLTPFGARIHAPWTTAVVRRLEQDRGLEVETMWTDDGMVFRVDSVEGQRIEKLTVTFGWRHTPDEVEI